MPETPTIDSSVAPQVSPGGSLPMDASPAAFGAGIGQGLENMGAGIEQIHREEMAKAQQIHAEAVQRANQTMALDADNQLNQWQYEHLIHPKTGILNQPLGRDAPGAVDATLANFDQTAGKIAQGLTNDEQRLTFQRMRQARQFEIQRQLSSYEHGETTRDQEEVHRAALANTSAEAIQYASDPDPRYRSLLVSGALAKQAALLKDNGKANGLPPEAITESIAEAASTTHLGVIRELSATGKDVSAKAWYEEHKGDLRGKDAIAAADIVEASSTAGEAQRESDRISATAKDLAEAKAEWVKITDPKLRDAVQTRVEHNFAQKHAEAEATANAAFSGAYETAKASPQGIYDPAVVTAMVGMEPQRQEQLKSYFKNGGVNSDDMQTWLAWNSTLSDTRKVEAVRQLNPLDLVGRMTDPTIKSLVERRDKILAGGGDAKLDEGMVKRVTDETAKINLIAPVGKATKEQVATAALFAKSVRDAVEAKTRSEGPQSEKQVQEIADNLIKPQIVPTSTFGINTTNWWQTTQPAFQAAAPTAIAEDSATLNDIPAVQERLSYAHGPKFDETVSALARVANGGDPAFAPLTQSGDALKAAVLIRGLIPQQERETLRASFKRANNGAEPTDADLLEQWAEVKRRTTPVQTLKQKVDSRSIPGFSFLD